MGSWYLRLTFQRGPISAEGKLEIPTHQAGLAEDASEQVWAQLWVCRSSWVWPRPILHQQLLRLPRGRPSSRRPHARCSEPVTSTGSGKGQSPFTGTRRSVRPRGLPTAGLQREAGPPVPRWTIVLAWSGRTVGHSTAVCIFTRFLGQLGRFFLFLFFSGCYSASYLPNKKRNK